MLAHVTISNEASVNNVITDKMLLHVACYILNFKIFVIIVTFVQIDFSSL